MEGEDEDDEDDAMSIPGDGIQDGTSNSGRKSSKKPETEEEKRKNFLERNRQGLFEIL
jgi:ATF/CREB family transcription factor